MTTSDIGMPSIELKAGDPSWLVPATNVYFPFASGRLSYDCVTCRAQCCRGHSYLSTVGREVQVQLSLRPHLKVFMDSFDGLSKRQVRTTNCAPACFFLSRDGLCDIHKTQGYDSKPETCRLFPFNQFRKAGEYLLVAPHPELCPLQVVSPGVASKNSSHHDLILAMSASGISANVRLCRSAGLSVESTIALERDVVAMSERYFEAGHYKAFVIAQLQLAVDRKAKGISRDASDISVHWNQRVESFLVMLAALFGLPRQDFLTDNVALGRLMVALVPFVRYRLAFRAIDGDESELGDPLSIERMPYALLALYAVMECAVLAGMEDVTFQSVHRIVGAFQPLLQLLAHWESPMAFTPGTLVSLAPFEDSEARLKFLRIVKALLPRAQERNPVPLGEVLTGHTYGDGAERILFLKATAKHLIGRIGPIDEEKRARPGMSRGLIAQAMIQRLALGRGSERMLLLSYDRWVQRQTTTPSRTQ